MHSVEKILKDIIDVSTTIYNFLQYGFADNVEEELLVFDDKGNLEKCIKGAKEKRREGGVI